MPTEYFDVVLCGLGLMYMPDPEAGLVSMAQCLRPGGRIAACGLDYRQAQAVHRLIQTAQLDITWPTEDQ